MYRTLYLVWWTAYVPSSLFQLKFSKMIVKKYVCQEGQRKQEIRTQ